MELARLGFVRRNENVVFLATGFSGTQRQPCAEAGSIYVIRSFLKNNMRPSGDRTDRNV
jgi:hypothetical protein